MDHRPNDDALIPADERIYLRVYPSADALVPLDGGEYRPNSGAFRRTNQDIPISADRGSLSSPEQTRSRGGPHFHVVALTAAEIRAIGCRVVRNLIRADDPNGDAPNAAHVLIYGSRKKGNDFLGGLTGGEAEKLARRARLVLRGDGAPPA